MSDFADLIADSLDPQILETFGDDVTYTPSAGVAYTLNCVLDSGEAVQDGQRVYQTAWAPLANFTAGEPARGDAVTINAAVYHVRDIERQHLDGRLLKISVAA